MIQAYKSYPFTKINSITKSHNSLSYLFNYIEFHNLDRQDKISIDYKNECSINNIPLTINICRIKNDFIIQLESNGNSFTKKTLEYINEYLLYYLKQIINNDIDLQKIPDKEYKKIISWSQAEKLHHPNLHIIQKFEQQSLVCANKTALINDKEIISYQQLNQKSNKFSHYIKDIYHKKYKTDISNKELILLCLDRNIDIVTSILAVLKVGAAYVPVEPNQPQPRMQYILEDIQAKIIITQLKYINLFDRKKDYLIIIIDQPDIQDAIKKQETTNPVFPLKYLQNTAYVLYTSGTTGKPKGIIVKHKSLSNYIYNAVRCFSIKKSDVLEQSLPIYFDASITSIFSSLVTGATLHIINNNIKSSPKFYSDYIQKNKITILKTTPSYFSKIKEFIMNSTQHDLKKIILGGEPVNTKIIHQYLKKKSNCHIYNEYGPTETTVGVTYYLYSPNKLETRRIGTPMYNNNVYVLGQNMGILPAGVPGEIYISGEGVASGYINQIDLTKTKFLKNPLYKVDHYHTLYKTSDIGYYDYNGYLNYLGRQDRQIKINGARIELEEIEKIINSFEYIQESIVLCKEIRGNDSIIAYIVSSNNTNKNKLQLDLLNYTPMYMIPKYFIFLNELPRTKNEKIDINKLNLLPIINKNRKKIFNTKYKIEKELQKIYCEIFSLNKAPINMSFFDLGGDSLLIFRLITLIYEKFD